MTMILPYLELPNPNDPQGLERHKDAVFTKFGAILGLADSALRDSIPKAKNIFALLGGTPDRAVHAMNTRYLVKAFLNSNAIPAEERCGNDDLDVEWVPNCGLFVKLAEAEFRILKASPLGVPKATSAARSRYYSSNQMLLALNGAGAATVGPTLPLTLVLLWDIDDEFNYVGLDVACPRAAKADGTVDCFWIARWRGAEPKAGSAAPTPGKPEGPDLEGITRIYEDKSRGAKKA